MTEQFCDEMMRRYDENNQFFNWICFSVEATFEMSGSVNRQNMRYWADVNPHWMKDSHTTPKKTKCLGRNFRTEYYWAVFYRGKHKCEELCAFITNGSRATYPRNYWTRF